MLLYSYLLAVILSSESGFWCVSIKNTRVNFHSNKCHSKRFEFVATSTSFSMMCRFTFVHLFSLIWFKSRFEKKTERERGKRRCETKNTTCVLNPWKSINWHSIYDNDDDDRQQCTQHQEKKNKNTCLFHCVLILNVSEWVLSWILSLLLLLLVFILYSFLFYCHLSFLSLLLP